MLWAMVHCRGSWGNDQIVALRQAQLWVMREGPRRGLDFERDDKSQPAPRTAPPFYWAAFVLSGDWR